MEKVFPGKLSAVIVGEDGEVSLALSDTLEAMPADQRVRISLRHGSGTVNVLTYSGQHMCVEMNGQQLCLTPLLTGENTVFVLTDRSVVLPSSDATLAGCRVSTEHLEGKSS